MSSEEQLRTTLRAQAANALDADAVHSNITAALRRRRRQRQVLQTTGAVLVVGGLAVSVPVLATRPGGDPAQSVPVDSSMVSTALPVPTKQKPPAKDSTLPGGGPSQPITTRHSTTLVNLFFARGYTFDEAMALAGLWHTEEPYEAKVIAGQLLTDGLRPPVRDGVVTGDGETSVTKVRDAFAQHHTAAEAQALATAWGDDAGTVELIVGQSILDGKPITVTS